MKLTDDILLEIGFNYSTVTKQFTLLVPNGPQITVYNKQVKNTYFMYFNRKPP
jgi:hypothetical protein